MLFLSAATAATVLAAPLDAAGQGEEPARDKIVIKGDVTINVNAGKVTTKASKQADGAPSVARNCIGTIGDGRSDVRIDGDVTISRTVGDVTGGCDCDQQGNPCTQQ